MEHTEFSNIIPVIQACADIESRTSRIKEIFGLPKWISRHFKTSRTPPSPVFSTTNTAALVNNAFPQIPTVSVAAKFLNQVVSNAEYTKNVIAREEVAGLSKPGSVVTSKERILQALETMGDYGATIAELRFTFPDIAPKGLSSRVSELVKAGLVESQKIEGNDGKLVTVYFIAV